MLNSNIYKVQWAKLARWIIPVEMRMPKQLSFVYSFIYPVALLHKTFMDYKKTVEYRLSINYQRCSLERLLNDRYDAALRRIYIQDVPRKEPVYFYKRDELKPVVFYTRAEDKPVIFYTRSEIGINAANFCIYVPAGIVFSNIEMIALVKNFCLPAQKIKIQIV